MLFPPFCEYPHSNVYHFNTILTNLQQRKTHRIFSKPARIVGFFCHFAQVRLALRRAICYTHDERGGKRMRKVFAVLLIALVVLAFSRIPLKRNAGGFEVVQPLFGEV